MREDTSQLRKGVLEIVVLALLERGQAYGGQLIGDLSGISGLEATSGTVYPLLTRLEKGGAVQSTWYPSAQGAPRKYYSITSEGRRRLQLQKALWDRLHNSVNSLLEEAEG